MKMSHKSLLLSSMTFLVLAAFFITSVSIQPISALEKAPSGPSMITLSIAVLASAPVLYYVLRKSDARLSERGFGLTARLYVFLVCLCGLALILAIPTYWQYVWSIARSYAPGMVRLFFVSFLAYSAYLYFGRPRGDVSARRLVGLARDAAMPIVLFFLVYIPLSALFHLPLIDVAVLIPLGLAVHYANTCAIAFAGAQPLDFNLVLQDGNRLLGDGVSVRGTAGGILGAFLFGIVAIGFHPALLLIGGLSAMIGDAVGSFAKRRLSLPSGYQVVLLDQVDSILPILALTSLAVLHLTLYQEVVLVLSTMLLPALGNVYLYLTDHKQVPW